MAGQLHRVDPSSAPPESTPPVPVPRVRLSIASPSEIEHTAQQLTAMREGFLTTGTPVLHTPRPMILASWQRCQALQVDPLRRYAPLAIVREVQLREWCERNEQFIHAAGPVMRHLTDLLADAGYVVALCDANGHILVLLGNPDVRRRLARIDFVPGGIWSEAASGTNAIGTALADGHVVQLMAAEHYCAGWQDLTCTAAPIHHPVTGAIMGVLDITGDYHLIRSHLTGLLAAGALEIEQELGALLVTGRGGERVATVHVAPAGAHGGAGLRAIDVRGAGRPASDVAVWPRPRMQETRASLLDDVQSRLHHQERRAREAELLAAAGGAISASLELPVTLDRVAEQTAHLLELDRAVVGLFNEAGAVSSVHVWPARAQAPGTWEALLGQAEAVGLVRERGEPVIIDDVLTSALLPAALGEALRMRSVALLPLAAARGVIGFIAAPRPVPVHWAVHEVRLGLALAAQAATAIENARLFAALQQHNRHMEALNAVAQFLHTLPDPSQHLDLVLERIAEIMNLKAGLVLLLDQEAGDLTLVAHRGLPEAVTRDLWACPLRPPEGVAGQVAATGEPLLICGAEVVDRRIARASLRAVGFRDVMAVPLAAGGAILGVLLLGSHSPRALTDEDLALVTAIGQQLGLALKNAQLLRSTRAMEALREADRLKSEFLAAVSHDLRSPLTAIRASVEGLLDHGGAQLLPEQEHLLHNIAGQAARLGRLVDQLLDLSRIEAGALALDCDWTELPALLADAVAATTALHSRRRVEHDLPADLPLLFVDKDRLVQVFCNLLENACKYTPAGSPIRVEAARAGTEVLIGVADRGPGVPAGERDAIFRRFYRLERGRGEPAKGSGLGLAICRGIVETHGGRIWVEDRAGGGSVFRVALPLPTAHPAELDVAEDGAGHGGRAAGTDP